MIASDSVDSANVQSFLQLLHQVIFVICKIYVPLCLRVLSVIIISLMYDNNDNSDTDTQLIHKASVAGPLANVLVMQFQHKKI